MKTLLTKKIIFDYLDGKHSSIQFKIIEDWLKIDENQELFYQYLDEWESQNPQYMIDTKHGFDKIRTRASVIIENKTNTELAQKQSAKVSVLLLFSIAASAMIVMFISWTSFLNPTKISYENLVENIRKDSSGIYEKENLTATPVMIFLPDESTVILQPSSKISYSPKHFGKLRREVVLSGEAFFEVQKNKNIPFFVYANELITKVLGTSFVIKANPKLKESTVIVRSGKVEVFLQNDLHKQEKINGNLLGGLVINANEKVTINRIGLQIEKPQLERQNQPEVTIQKIAFDFENTSAIEVFEVLKNTYDVEIIFDQTKLASCKLTAHFLDESLLEKIKLICIALDATYIQVDNKFVIKSNGCLY